MRTLVCTGCMGIAKEYMHLTVPTIEAYAKRIKSDFYLIDESNRMFSQYKPTYEKFQIKDFLEKYNRVLWVDCDVIIKPNISQSIFNEVSEGLFGVLWEGRDFREDKTRRRLKREIREVQEGLGFLNWKTGYFNAGVMVFSQNHKILFKDGFEYAIEKKCWTWNDQTVLNYHRFKYNVPTCRLDPKWNSFDSKFNEDYLIGCANFIHFSGRKQKKNMEGFISKLEKFHKEIS